MTILSSLDFPYRARCCPFYRDNNNNNNNIALDYRRAPCARLASVILSTYYFPAEIRPSFRRRRCTDNDDRCAVLSARSTRLHHSRLSTTPFSCTKLRAQRLPCKSSAMAEFKGNSRETPSSRSSGTSRRRKILKNIGPR